MRNRHAFFRCLLYADFVLAALAAAGRLLAPLAYFNKRDVAFGAYRILLILVVDVSGVALFTDKH